MNKKTAIVLLTAAALIALALAPWQTADGYRSRYSNLKGVPPGTIVMWGSAAAPSGWVICDGTKGTPDLRAKFVIGVSGSYALDATGGAANHAHGQATASQSDSLPGGSDVAAGGDMADTTSGHTHEIESDSNIPPYHALNYIMKL